MAPSKFAIRRAEHLTLAEANSGTPVDPVWLFHACAVISSDRLPARTPTRISILMTQPFCSWNAVKRPSISSHVTFDEELFDSANSTPSFHTQRNHVLSVQDVASGEYLYLSTGLCVMQLGVCLNSGIASPTATGQPAAL